MRRQTLERMQHSTVAVDLIAIAMSFSALSRKVQWRLRCGPMVSDYNCRLREELGRGFDLLWVEKGVFVWPDTLAAARKAGIKTVLYSPDNYFIAQNTSRHLKASFPLYDLIVTTKADKVAQLKRAGARAVVLSGNAYDPETHRPIPETDPARAKFACDVSFVGRWERDREALLERVAQTGVKLSIRGIQWERARSPGVRQAMHREQALGTDYARAICAAKINLGFLSKLAGDSITQRSVEIPACGGFLLAEKSEEHLAHFVEDGEAVYYKGVDELLHKISHYLRHDRDRLRIAKAGRARCLSSGYSYESRLGKILVVLDSIV